MRHFVALALMIVGFGGFLAAQSIDAAEASGGDARILAIDGAITPLEAKHFSNAIDEAHETGAEILIVQLSTPGGLLESTREMVEDIFASPLPVVVYVSPSGARAASAGTFITAAAHVAAMAPATNIGAASPVGAGGDDLPDTLRAKATQDAAAFLRSIASQRNRNAEALQDTVLDAVSYTATEALELQVVDLKAENLSDLLTQLHGMTIDLNGEKVQLDTDGLTTTTIERTPVEHLHSFSGGPKRSVSAIDHWRYRHHHRTIQPWADRSRRSWYHSPHPSLPRIRKPARKLGGCRLDPDCNGTFLLRSAGAGHRHFRHYWRDRFSDRRFSAIWQLNLFTGSAGPAKCTQFHGQSLDNRGDERTSLRLDGVYNQGCKTGAKNSLILRPRVQQYRQSDRQHRHGNDRS